MAEMNFNLVRLVCDAGVPGDGAGPRLEVALDGPFSIKAGVEPSVNSVSVPWGEFDRLGGDTSRTGTLECWYNHLPGGSGKPDFTFKFLSIVDVKATAYGVVSAAGDRRIVRYQLFLADVRHRWKSPFGGNLRLGTVNGAETTKLRKNSDLIELCLAVMGYSRPGVDHYIPPEADLRPPMRNLQWRSAHAPTELAKILDHCGLVLALQSNGMVVIEAAGTGPGVAVPKAQVLPDLNLPNIDRRGKVVVFTSGPHAIINRATIEGPSVQTWEFVAENEQGKWTLLKDLGSLLGGKSPAQVVQNNFEDVPAAYRERMRNQFYRVIRLQWERNPFAILRRVPFKPGDEREIEVEAKIVARRADGLWENASGYVRCTALMLVHPITGGDEVPHAILWVNERLGKMQTDQSGKTEDWEKYFVELEGADVDDDGKKIPADLRVTIAHEAIETKSDGTPVLDAMSRPQPRYFDVGFIQDADGVKQLDDAALRNALADPNTMIVSRPEMVLYTENGDPKNKAELVAEAKALASRYLKGSGDPPRLVSGVGFYQAELSGRVAEIRITQRPPRVECMVNTWHSPVGAVKLDEWRKKGEAKSVAAEQHATAALKTAYGAEGHMQPTAPITPTPAPSSPAAGKGQLAKIFGAAGDGGKYQLHLMTGNSSAVMDFNPGDPEALVMPEGLTEGTELCVGLNPEESGQDTHWLKVPGYAVVVDHGRKKHSEGTGSNTRVVTIAAAAYRDSDPVILADAQAWNRSMATEGAVVGGVPMMFDFVQTVYWDETNGVLRQKRRTALVDAGGKLSLMTVVTDSVVDTAEDCA